MKSNIMLKPRDIIFVAFMAFIGVVLFLQATKSDDSSGRRVNSYILEIEKQKKSELQNECLALYKSNEKSECNPLVQTDDFAVSSLAFLDAQ
jgi:hypothetical protein